MIIANEISEDEEQALLADANNPPDEEALNLLKRSLEMQSNQGTPSSSTEMDSDDQLVTNETTWTRLKRYAANAWSSADSDWDSDNSDRHFTGSDDTSGGIKDFSDYQNELSD